MSGFGREKNSTDSKPEGIKNEVLRNDLKCKASWLQRHEWPPLRAKCSSIAGETCATKVGHGGKMQKMQQDVMSRCRLVYMLSRTSSICLQGI